MPGEGKARVNEHATAERGECGDELTERTERFAGVEIARPRADALGGVEVGVAVGFEDFARERIER